MPYIEQEKRFNAKSFPIGPGELNYCLTEIIINYTLQNRLSYNTINDIIGALECCKVEYMRRVVHPYEDRKIKENGDVYPDVLK